MQWSIKEFHKFFKDVGIRDTLSFEIKNEVVNRHIKSISCLNLTENNIINIYLTSNSLDNFCGEGRCHVTKEIAQFYRIVDSLLLQTINEVMSEYDFYDIKKALLNIN